MGAYRNWLVLSCWLMLGVFCHVASQAMDQNEGENESYYREVVAVADQRIAFVRALHGSSHAPSRQEELSQCLYDDYMKKGEALAHLGDRESQLACYRNIIALEGLPKITRGCAYFNISTVYLTIGKHFQAAGFLQKAEAQAPLETLAGRMGTYVFEAFGTIYAQVARDLFWTHQSQAVTYLKRLLEAPQVPNLCRIEAHLGLALHYSWTAAHNEAIEHGIKTLALPNLHSKDKDRALCHVSLGHMSTGRDDDGQRYFEQISDIDHLEGYERQLLLVPLVAIYFKKGDVQTSILLLQNSIKSFDPNDALCLLGKYALSIVYGQSGETQKEAALCTEILEKLDTQVYLREWQGPMAQLRMAVETFFFLKDLSEHSPEAGAQTLAVAAQKKADRKSPSAHHRQGRRPAGRLPSGVIDEIRRAQNETLAREQRLEEEKIRKAEAKEAASEGFGMQLQEAGDVLFEPPPFTQARRFIPRPREPKVKTRKAQLPGPAQDDQGALDAQDDEPEGVDPAGGTILPTLPQLGTRGRKVFEQIENEDWDFTREEYSCLLVDLKCERRETGGSHRIFQIPKTTLLSLKLNGEEVQEPIFWADEDAPLGSVTLPVWRGTVPVYLRKQLRLFHRRVLTLYTKVTTRMESTFATQP